MGDAWAEANIFWRRAEAERIAPQPDRDAMFGDYAAADSAFVEMGARPSRARLLRDWGNALKESGQADAGAEKLRGALGLFEEIRLEREAGEVREELAPGS